MRKVLRGGKWRTLSQHSAPSSHPDSRPDSRPQSQPPPAPIAEPDHQGAIISLLEQKKDLAVACYDFPTNEIHISRVTPDCDYSLVHLAIDQTSARAVVLPNSYNSHHVLLNSIRGAAHHSDPHRPASPPLKKTRTDVTNVSQQSSHEPIVSFIPNTEFGHAKATHYCSLICVASMPVHLDPADRLASLLHLIGEEDSIVRAMGGLLSFLLRNGVLGSLAQDTQMVQVNGIVYRDFFDVMKLTPTTLRGIGVFTTDLHPVGYGNLKGKEGMSLFGILKSHVKTAAARELLRSWLRYPSTSLETIRQRQFVVDILRRSCNSAFLVAVKDTLRGVKNVPAILLRVRRISAGASDWKGLHLSLKSFMVLIDTFKVAVHQNADLNQSPLLSKFAEIDESRIRDSLNWIDAVVDFEESTASGRMVVAQGFSEEIDEMKRSYSALDDFLTSVGVEEHQRLQGKENAVTFSALHFTYHPQIGYMVAVPEADCDRIGVESLEMSGMEFIYRSSEQEYHFKNERCRELDNEIGDIHGAIVDLEAKAFRYLETKVLTNITVFHNMFSIVRELDCLQAFASAAMEYSWVQPEFVDDDDAIRIEEGRHPLLDLLVPSFIPNTTNLRCGDVQVLTGPNYSGKSSYLTQVALILVLAQIGSYVPAKQATLTIVNRINSRIANFESVSRGQSSFFMDACEVAGMLRPYPSKSLNLIDEFGKGTAEADGMALLAATIQHFLKVPTDHACYTLCATHFVEILADPILPLTCERLILFSMEVLSGAPGHPNIPNVPALSTQGDPTNAESSQGEIAPSERNRKMGQERNMQFGTEESLNSNVRTFRLLPGAVCHESRGLLCALEAGVPRFVLRRAAHIRAAVGATGAIEEVVASCRNNGRLKVCEKKVRDFLAFNYEENLDV